MNELVVVDQAPDWRRLKALVLDSISSPITRRVYNLGLDKFIGWYTQEPRLGFTKIHRGRLAGITGGSQARPAIDQRPTDRRSEVAVEAAGSVAKIGFRTEASVPVPAEMSI